MTRPYRLLKVGPPEDPGVVYVLSPDEDQLWMTDGNHAEVLGTARSLERLSAADLPQWLQEQGHPLTLTPVQEARASSPAELSERLMEAARTAYSPERCSASRVGSGGDAQAPEPAARA